MSRLIFVNRFFFPDHSATSQILSDLAFHLAGSGRDVQVVTSRQVYDDPKAALPGHDIVNGVHVHRIPSTHFGRSSLLGRSIDYASFYRSIRRCLSALAVHGDVVIVKTDPPLLSVAAMAPVRRNGARLVNWLQDIYPETAAILGVPLMRGPVANGLAALRDRSLRRSAASVVVGELMARRIANRGAAETDIHVIANWCNDTVIRPLAAEQNPLRRQMDLTGKFVLGYSGNLGRAHDHETVLGAAEQLRHDPRYVFLMVGGGKRFADLADMVRRRGLDSAFRFLPYQPSSLLRECLTLPDAHWLTLNPRLEGLIVPSKFYGIAAAGKPMIFIGAKDGELARLVRQHACGVVVAPGDAGTLVATLQRWSDAPAAVAEMGARGRAMLDARFTRQHALAHWSDFLDRLDRGTS